MSPDDRARAHFAFALLNDAVSPSNTLLNPLAIKEIFNSGGNSLVRGLSHLVDDFLHNDGLPRQVTKQAFEVGKTVATTTGSVVFRNELLELIQYKPMSEKQYSKPLLTLWQDRQRASADVKALARQHIDELNQKIRELGQLRDTLQDLVEHCQGDHRPDCPILKELASGCCAEPARA